MEVINLPDFIIDTNSPAESLLELMKIIKPNWLSSEIKINPVIGGYSNLTYRVQLKDDVTNAITVKTRFSNENIGPVNREFEKKIIKIVSKVGLFPKVHAIFKNGYCYDYILGRPVINYAAGCLESDRLSEKLENLPYKLMASKLAQIHSVKIDDEDFSKSTYFDHISELLENKYPELPSGSIVNKATIQKEFSELMGYMKNFNFKIVLSHGDTHPGNIVWNKEEDKVTFMDWECTHIGFQAYNIASFFVTFTFPEFVTIPGVPVFEKELAEQLKKDFLNSYLEEYNRLQNGNLSDFEEEFTELERQVKFFSLVQIIVTLIFLGARWSEIKEIPDWTNILPMATKSFNYYTSIKDKTLRCLKLN